MSLVSRSTLSPPRSPQRRPFIVRAGKRLRPTVDRLIARWSRIPNAPVLNPADFSWVPLLEASWQTVRDEALRVLAHRDAIPPLNAVSPDHARIAGDGKWRSFFLYGYGHRIADNCARAPFSAALVEKLPGLNSAFFSILEPGAHIPRHRGVTKGIFTAHLGLVTPQRSENCRMQVDGSTVHWQDGRCLLFDDTYPHEVWNDTNEMRVVLLIQLTRPVSFPGSLVSRFFLGGVRKSAFVRETVANLGNWERAYRALEQDEPC